MGKNNRRRSRKRRGAKAADRMSSGAVVPSGMYGLTDTVRGISDSFRTDMPYGVQITVTVAAATTTYYSFRGNSVYDPDYSSTGTTALNYSKLSLLYNRYRILASSAELTCACIGASPITCYLIATIANSPPAKEPLLGSKHVAYGYIAPGGPAVWKHCAGIPTHKVFGVPAQQVLSEDDFAGLVGGNPNNVWYWHVVFYNASAVNTTVDFALRLNYQTVWSMPLTVSP
jgi:hypothetical protein